MSTQTNQTTNLPKGTSTASLTAAATQPHRAQCPVCESQRTRRLVAVLIHVTDHDEPADIYECTDCTHRFMPTSEHKQKEIEEVYDEAYTGFRDDPVFRSVIEQELRMNFLPRHAPPARMLDVGCGNGAFLAAAAELGYQAEGIDVSEAAADCCRSRGLTAVAGDFLTAPYERESFDFITLWDVIEHLRNPRAFLNRAHDLLRPGGFLVIKAPGYGAGSFRLLRYRPTWSGLLLSAPGHVQYFQEESMNRLLNECRFKQVTFYSRGNFRGRPQTRSLRRLAGRAVRDTIKWASGNRNVYVFAQPDKN